ncbi:hypothetical protein MMC24_005562 [Lignoscripta atroalba]|nr:hypothetical protein [Lignoscripta atroalba]
MDKASGTVVYSYLPPGVQKILSTGSMNFIGFLDDNTVLKYPHEAEQGQASLGVEAAILKVLGSHPRIVKLKGEEKSGLRLELVPHGRLDEYLKNAASPISRRDRLKWCRQAAEATAYIHQNGVIHCDIRLGNLLLDENFDIKMCDFQGIYRAPDGMVLDGGAGENTKSSLPRSNPLHADQNTDIFALGTAIYHIMRNHEPYPELDSLQDEAEIVERYRSGRFPADLEPALCGHIVRKCWNIEYESADQVVENVKALESALESANP